jgi:aspartyl-tRNA synthetase
LTSALRDFLLKKNFIEIHTPKLIAAASESGSEVFEISNYFDKKAYLAQSPQFYKQMAIASGFERVFEVGPVFRAEKSRSNRHATEFTGFDLELSGIKDVNELMQFENNLLIEGFKSVNKKYGKDIEQLFNLKLNLPPKKIPVITLPKLFEVLASKYQYKVDIKDQTDLTAEGEKLAGQYAQETYQSDFLFVINYSKDVRPFYHLRDKNGIPQGFDLIYRGVEITSGSMREHRYDVLKKQADEKHLSKDVAFYLQFFKYGIAPHGGFGLGLDRVVMLMLGLTIKEACLCFRDPDRLLP